MIHLELNPPQRSLSRVFSKKKKNKKKFQKKLYIGWFYAYNLPNLLVLRKDVFSPSKNFQRKATFAVAFLLYEGIVYEGIVYEGIVYEGIVYEGILCGISSGAVALGDNLELVSGKKEFSSGMVEGLNNKAKVTTRKA